METDAVVIGSGALGRRPRLLARQARRSTSCSSTASTSSRRRPRAPLAWRRRRRSTMCSPSWRSAASTRSPDSRSSPAQPLDVVVNGSVKVARTEADAEQLREEVAPRRRARRADRRGQRGGGQACAPWLNADDAVAISYSPTDVYQEEPGALPRAFVAALADLGGRSLPNTEVTGFLLDGEEIQGVRTSRHDRGAHRRRRRRRVDAQPRPPRRHQDPALPGAPPALHHRAAERGRADASRPSA